MATNETKRTPAITADTYGTVLTLTFSDGRELEIDAAKLSEGIRTEGLLHGLKQKLVDAAAIARNTDTGGSATLDDKFDAVKVVFDRITDPNGTWNKGPGESTGGTAALLVQAIMRLRGKAKGEVEDYLKTLSKDQKAALRQNPKVIDAIAAIQREKTRDTAESDALLDGLA